METTIDLNAEFIKLDSLLKLAGVAGSGGQAKLMVLDGLVSLNGELVEQRGRKIRAGDVVVVATSPVSTITVK